ncbi:hypothetical protein RFI_31998 [Reticulomyxa filosa]|uniref:Endonuclease/exonuclease/phosphatase domain-containing protein n=1 Tax=Reticulomyxa filosa TaxID=46433 RepID=X6LU29_RETFI|nr:hypothetical protein RFI_31998 [Reticulomyxa filosa]|eukprot:ETO05398.1 hypothetical protein RFI_31998 [Reticulomyxa filosa]
MCSSSLFPLCSNWRTDCDEMDVHSDHLPITFNIKAVWSSSKIERQKIETWNLKSNKWEQFRRVLANRLEEWRNNIPQWLSNDPQQLNIAVEQWTDCITGFAKITIGIRTKAQESAPIEKAFRRNRTEENYKNYKQAASLLKRKLRQEKQEHMIKSIQNLQEGNSRQLFSQFRSMNSNKITVIPSIICPGTNSIAKTNSEKAELFVSWFSQPPQPPGYSDEIEDHYQLVEDDITSAVEMTRERELNDWTDIIIDPHQCHIT